MNDARHGFITSDARVKKRFSYLGMRVNGLRLMREGNSDKMLNGAIGSRMERRAYHQGQIDIADAEYGPWIKAMNLFRQFHRGCE